jgi:pSer/pThr/pTyr-binding forkhead associated (FHA) protein
MRRVEGGYELHDAGSTNGIKLDGVRYEEIPLRSGVTVKIGDVSFDFLLSDEEAEALAREKPPEPSPITREPELEQPQSQPPRRAAVASQASGGGGFGAALIFVILASAAFFAGMAIRYQKETGGSMIEAIQAKSAVKKTPTTPPQR